MANNPGSNPSESSSLLLVAKNGFLFEMLCPFKVFRKVEGFPAIENDVCLVQAVKCSEKGSLFFTIEGHDYEAVLFYYPIDKIGKINRGYRKF